MRLIGRVVAVSAAFIVAACGGGGSGCDAGTSSFAGTTNTCTGTGTVATTTAAQLNLQLDATSVDNSGAKTVTATATATTAGGQTISGVPVTFTVDNNAIYTPSGPSTDGSGVARAVVSIGADRSNRIVTVTAQSGELTATRSFAVTGATLTGTRVPAIATPGSTNNRVDFRLVDANNNPMPGQPIAVTAGTLAPVTGVTGAAGEFAFKYTAPSTSGSIDIVATSGGVSNTQMVLVQAANNPTVPAVTARVRSASVTADPSVVAPNDVAGSTSNRVEVRALFVGQDNLPIKNMRVRFDLPDPNNVGGTLSTGGGTTVYSDDLGVATTAYIPGPRSSPTNGVVIRACYDYVDFTTCNTSQAATTTLTVAQPPLAVTIGTNRLVVLDTLTYKQQFVILVTDSAGVAKGNVTIVPSIDLEAYFKGFYERLGDTWENSNHVAGCANEDLNRNGVLENLAPIPGEDLNGNGTIEPRKSDVAISVVGSNQTDSSGKATIQIEYPKNVGSWLLYKILVSATGVAGTEGRATWRDMLLVPNEDVKAEPPPAFIRSPYGIATVPVDKMINGTLVTGIKPCFNAD